MKSLLSHVVGFRLPIERLHAKFKMGQDEPLPDTQGAIDRLSAGTDPALADAMKRENQGRI